MKIIVTLLPALTISACSSMQSSDPASLLFDIPKGSSLTLNRDLPISENNTHALIQAGKVLKGKANEYDINCRFDVKKFGPRTIKPETFTIRRTEDGREWFSEPVIMRFYTIIYLDSSKGTDVIKMECQQWGDATDNNFTVAEMAAALGDIFSFNFKGSGSKE
ncbi:MAG: hypothetical protein LJE83_14525 [Gammaproteobacteria bacterium]|nr:hypothetical protein [Gammaproteobacteria bacterium]